MLHKLPAFGALVLALSACTTVSSKPRPLFLSDGLVVATNLCGKNNTVRATNDAPGDRAVCELETVVGTHVPKCVCRDQKQMDLDREETQQYLREVETKKQNLRGG